MCVCMCVCVCICVCVCVCIRVYTANKPRYFRCTMTNDLDIEYINKYHNRKPYIYFFLD